MKLLMMTTTLAVAVCLSSADAKMRWVAGMPPTKYDIPYTGNLAIQRFHVRNNIPCHDNKIACAFNPKPEPTQLVQDGPRPWCYLIIGSDKLLVAENPNYTYAAVLRHELGHCNGWPGNHPGMRAIMPENIKTPKLPTNVVYLPPDDLNSVCWANKAVKVCEPNDTWIACPVDTGGVWFCPRSSRTSTK